MGTGSWGCGAHDPARPCQMGAWTRHVLGWIEVDDLPPGADHDTVVLGPVSSSGRALRVEAQDGSGEYFLLENRQREGFDVGLHAEGLLVWHIDRTIVDTYWPFNTVNNVATRQGVWLRQADGQPYMTNRGDAGDPFPGSKGNRAFHAGSFPKAFTHGGNPSGLTLFDIEQVGDDMAFRALTRFQAVTLRTENETTGGLLRVDGTGLPGTSSVFQSAPFQNHVIEAAAGEPLEPGHRRGFEAWTDDAAASRVRPIQTGLTDAEYVARYGAEQLQLAVPISGGQYGVEPGALTSTPASPDLWFAPGTEVTLEASATTGFSFSGWTGALQGQANPAFVTMDAPVSAGAQFTLTYTLPAEVEVTLEAAALPELQFAAPEGTAPFFWELAGGGLPEGLTLLPDGRLAGYPLDMGTFPIQLRVTDDRGLEAVGGVRLIVGPPAIPMARLAAPFVASGGEPTIQQKIFLDRFGNSNGYYDLGDLRNFLRAHPDAALAAPASSGIIVVPLGPMAGRRPEGRP
jgi:hypothetical protein